MRKILVFITFLFMPVSIAQSAPIALNELPEEQCTVQEVTARLQSEVAVIRMSIAKQMLVVLDQQEKLVNKADKVDHKKPLKDSLSIDDNIEFTKNGEHIKAMMTADLLESRKIRDLKAILKMAQIADKNYRWQEMVLDEKDPDYFLQLMLSGFSTAKEKANIKFDNIDTAALDNKKFKCSLDAAITLLMKEPAEKINNYYNQNGGKKAEEELEALALKYGKPIEESKLSGTDKEIYITAKSAFTPIIDARNFLESLENIKILAHASDMLYQENKQDALSGGGDFNNLGKSLKEKYDAGALNKVTVIALNVWDRINEKIPADVVQDWAKLSSQK
jgi:hypothetical protein